VFLYPGTRQKPQGKLRLLYEAAPLAFLIEQAGGQASDGQQPIMDLIPDRLHARSPLIIGSSEEVNRVESLLQRGSG
jgi:fructose-1,6-bisphosphatase I